MEDIKSFEPFWGKWYVKKEIGEGGYGKVYSIKREEFGNVYEAALKHISIPTSQSEVKSIRADGLDDASITSYFKEIVGDIVKEFFFMAKLKGNSNVVSYEDHDVISKKDGIGYDIFIRMELLTNLIDYIRENDIGRNDVVKLGIDICKALELCQKYNIIHRDIKPENIFVSEIGEYKLGDFGIARQADRTMSGMSKKGTFTYIAPEVYKGEAYGSTVDIYSLGLVMYRLLNGNRLPFMPPYPKHISHREREQALVMRLSGQPFPLPGNEGGRLSEIILKACAYHSKDRYSSPHSMRIDLEDILYSEREKKILFPEGDNIEQNNVNYVDCSFVTYETAMGTIDIAVNHKYEVDDETVSLAEEKNENPIDTELDNNEISDVTSTKWVFDSSENDETVTMGFESVPISYMDEPETATNGSEDEVEKQSSSEIVPSNEQQDLSNEYKKENYYNALTYMRYAQTKEEYQTTLKMLETVSDYEGAETKIEECKAKILECENLKFDYKDNLIVESDTIENNSSSEIVASDEQQDLSKENKKENYYNALTYMRYAQTKEEYQTTLKMLETVSDYEGTEEKIVESKTKIEECENNRHYKVDSLIAEVNRVYNAAYSPEACRIARLKIDQIKRQLQKIQPYIDLTSVLKDIDKKRNI